MPFALLEEYNFSVLLLMHNSEPKVRTSFEGSQGLSQRIPRRSVTANYGKSEKNQQTALAVEADQAKIEERKTQMIHGSSINKEANVAKPTTQE